MDLWVLGEECWEANNVNRDNVIQFGLYPVRLAQLMSKVICTENQQCRRRKKKRRKKHTWKKNLQVYSHHQHQDLVVINIHPCSNTWRVQQKNCLRLEFFVSFCHQVLKSCAYLMLTILPVPTYMYKVHALVLKVKNSKLTSSGSSWWLWLVPCWCVWCALGFIRAAV